MSLCVGIFKNVEKKKEKIYEKKNPENKNGVKFIVFVVVVKQLKQWEQQTFKDDYN